MNKNEIVARFMNLADNGSLGTYIHVDIDGNDWGYDAKGLMYDKDYNWLHEAWVKFRDLKFDQKTDYFNHSHHSYACLVIGNAIIHKSITEAFDELVKGIEWYNQLKQK